MGLISRVSSRTYEMESRGSAAVLPYNLPHLQNLIKRDPESYQDEFKRQYSRFESMLEIFKLDPEQPNNPDFCELVQFLAAVSTCYQDILLPKKSEEKDSGVDLETSTPTSFPGK